MAPIERIGWRWSVKAAIVAARPPGSASANVEIVALHDYPFSLPFYLRDRQPIRVVDDWDNPKLFGKDNWRRELYDAAKFDPVRARVVLLKPAGLRHLLACSERSLWVIGAASATTRLPELAHLQQVAGVGPNVLWRRAEGSPTSEGANCGP